MFERAVDAAMVTLGNADCSPGQSKAYTETGHTVRMTGCYWLFAASERLRVFILCGKTGRFALSTRPRSVVVKKS